MKTSTKTMIFAFLIATAAGVLLHNLYSWLPIPLTALFSPVVESLWEHVKLLFYPLLAAALFFGRDRRSRAVRLWSALIPCGALLLVSFVYHVLLRGENFVFDIVLYAGLMAAGFLLPRLLWPLGERGWFRKAAAPLTALVWALIFWFTFYPPDGPLFADMETVRTFFTIPV